MSTSDRFHTVSHFCFSLNVIFKWTPVLLGARAADSSSQTAGVSRHSHSRAFTFQRRLKLTSCDRLLEVCRKVKADSDEVMQQDFGSDPREVAQAGFRSR